jgi:serine/threonine protein kinase/Tol biopolymer transport system component
MTPERWQMVRDILQSAMELRPAERAVYLDRECASDPSLRKDVGEMLSIEGKLDPGFLESPAAAQVELPGRSFASASILAAGTRLGNYELRALLGAGGMGQVYRARDLLLKREVAIKIIPNFYSSDPDRLHRFKQEAEATAALNHPNILTVYQVGEHHETFYIVAELLQGETLRERLRTGPLPVRNATDYGVQITRGLAAAHESGIIHRDIKPENIFVTKDGRIKILDFGLAKLVEHRRDHRADEEKPKSGTTQWTEPGLALGTTAYMSPEQVRGSRIDHRSDIFAFGAVLYEMLTGRLAFAKPTAAETMTAILNEDPPALSQSGQNLPPGMQRLIQRCLEKQPEQRFQSASDLAFALEALSESVSGPAVAVAERSRPRWLWTAAGVLGALAVLLYGWWRIPPAIPVVESVAQLTGNPHPKSNLFTDGARIYFNEGWRNVKIAQVSVTGGPMVPIETKLADPYISGVARDGSALLAFIYDADNSSHLWSIPLPAGEPRRLGSAAVQSADVFPDGRLVLSAGQEDVLVAENNGSNPRKLVSFPGKVTGVIAVSPDGGRVLLAVAATGDNKYDTWEITADGSGLREIRKGSPDECCFSWGWDGRYLLYSARAGPRWDLWAFPLRRGLFRRSKEPIRLTNGPQSYSQGALLSRDGRQIFAVASRERGELVRYDMESHQLLPLLSGISATDATYSKDGKWVAFSTYPDHALWRSRSDGSERMQLTFPPMEVWEPFISPDGTKVVFDNMSDNSIGIVDMTGGPPKKIVEKGDSARWSPDGRSLVFDTKRSDGVDLALGIVEVSTGKVSEVPSSKDKGGAFWLDQETLGADENLKKLLLFDLRTKKWTDLVAGDFENWINSPDGKYVYFAAGGPESSVQRIRVADRHVETITSLKDFPRVMNFGLPQLRVAPDGSPTLTRDVDPQQVYALNVRWP